MSRIVIVCVALFSAAIARAQVPNAGFETWSSGNPDGWIAQSGSIPGSIEQSNIVHGGSWAARGNVVNFFTNIPPSLSAGDDGMGFPVSQRHAMLSGFHRFNPVGGDIFAVTVVMSQGGSPIGGGGFISNASQASYVQFDVPIFYSVPGNPDTAYIHITIIDTATGLTDVGSYFIVDDLAFSGITSVDGSGDAPGRFALDQNYPNPFNPATNITFSIPTASFVSLKVFDVLGRRVADLVSADLPVGSHAVAWDAAGVPGGVYFYRLDAGAFSSIRKLVLLK